MYCGIHVYEKLDGMSAWLLGFIALRELLFDQQRNVVDALCDDVGYFIHAQSLAQSGIYLQIWANRELEYLSCEKDASALYGQASCRAAQACDEQECRHTLTSWNDLIH